MPSMPSGPRAIVFNVLLVLTALAAVDQDIAAPEPPAPAAEVGEDWLRPSSVYSEISRKPPATAAEMDQYNRHRRSVARRLHALADKEAIIDEATKIVYEGFMYMEALHQDKYASLRQHNEDINRLRHERSFQRCRGLYEALEMERKDRAVANQEIIAAKLEGRPKNVSKTEARILGFGKTRRERDEDEERRFAEFQEELEATERFANELTNRLQNQIAADSGDSTDEPMLQTTQESPTTDSSIEAVSMANRREEEAEEHVVAQGPSAGDVTAVREEPAGEAIDEETLLWAWAL